MHTQTHTQCLLKTNVKFYSNKDIRTMVNCTFNKNFKDRYCQLTQKAQDQPIHPKGGGDIFTVSGTSIYGDCSSHRKTRYEFTN